MRISVRSFNFQWFKQSLTEYLRIKSKVLCHKFSSDINHDNNNLNKYKYKSYLLKCDKKGCLLFLIVKSKFISKITN